MTSLPQQMQNRLGFYFVINTYHFISMTVPIMLLICMTGISPVEFENGTGAQFEGDLGEILALGAEISPYIGLREKWESP